MTAVVSTLRLVIPAPEGGFLTSFRPVDALERLALSRDWREQAAKCARIAELPKVGRVRLLVVIRLPVDERRAHHVEDVRASLNACLDGLVDARVLPSTARSVVAYEELRMGAPDLEGGQLVLRLESAWEVFRG